MRKASIILTLSLALFSRSFSQTTSNCLDVESILVNACGPIEGYNEMVRVLVGPNPLTVSSLGGSWPNLPFDPWVMNATTASKTAGLNATITTCGYLLEPLNNIIPANKKFIIVPSYLIDVNQNTFDGLTDTLYIIYQNSTNGTGRFANSGTGTRTLTLTYPGCVNETATYAPGSLQNVDGARVDFDIPGNPTYLLGGCTAPVVQFTVDAGANPPASCPGATINLQGSVIGSANYIHWSGGTGNFSSPNNTTTSYTISGGQTNPFWLYLRVKGACPDTLVDSVLVTIQTQNPLQINASGALSICTGDNLTLTATGGGASYQWVGGPSTAQYTINTPGTYTVQSSDACYNYQQSVTVSTAASPTISLNPSVATICPGGSVSVSATISSGTVSWVHGATGTNINVTAPGVYIANVTNGCGTASDTIVVSAASLPTAQITTAGPVNICSGNNVQLNGNGTGTLVWSNGTSGNSTTVNQSGIYYLIAQNTCGTDTASILVNVSNTSAQFSANPTTGFAPLVVNMINQSTDANTYFWDFGNGNTSTEESPNETFNTPGTYTITLAVTNAQGCVDTMSVEIVVNTEMSVELPNIFTPNGDSVNDEYTIKATGVASLKAEIYNRWGEKMFSWNDPNTGWNGISPLGVKASPGVYFCVVEAVDALGEKHQFKTTITLIH